MRAAVLQGRGLGHRIETVPDPDPGQHQVVVRVERAGVCGSDVSLTKARDTPTLMGPAIDEAFSTRGTILGHEFTGEVVALGAGVERLRLGDRIAPMFFSGCARCVSCLSGSPELCPEVTWSMGGYGQYALAHDRFSVVLDPEVPPGVGALVEPIATSLRTATVAEISSADRVLVLGAGALGLGVLYFARRMGATRTVAVARSNGKRAAARLLGADHFLTTSPDLGAEVADLLGGPPDVVFETAGAVGLVNEAIHYVRPGGTVVVAGACLDPEMTAHTVGMLKNLTVRYTAAYTVRDFEMVADLLRDPQSPLLALPGQPVGLDGFDAAFESLRTGGAAGKVMLDPWQA